MGKSLSLGIVKENKKKEKEGLSLTQELSAASGMHWGIARAAAVRTAVSGYMCMAW